MVRVKRGKDEKLKDLLGLLKTTTSENIANSRISASEIKSTILNFLEFDSEIGVHAKEKIFFEMIRNVDFSKRDLIKELLSKINWKASLYLGEQEKKYYIVSAISLKGLLFKELTVLGNKIRFYTKVPKKFEPRIPEHEVVHPNDLLPKGYVVAIVQVNDRDKGDAVDSALMSLNLFRAILCLLLNPAHVYMSAYNPKPLNSVLLSPLHSLHDFDGSVLPDGYYSDGFVEKITPKSLDGFDVDVLKKNVTKALRHVQLSNYKMHLIDSFIRFVKAFDERDKSFALVNGWGVLESLMGYRENSLDKVVKRTVSLFYKNQKYHRIVLDNLRDVRNDYVHSGVLRERWMSQLCSQLQHYIFVAFFFHLEFGCKFKTIEDSYKYISYKQNPDQLEIDKRILKLLENS